MATGVLGRDGERGRARAAAPSAAAAPRRSGPSGGGNAALQPDGPGVPGETRHGSAPHAPGPSSARAGAPSRQCDRAGRLAHGRPRLRGPCNTSAVRCGPRLPWQRDARPGGRRRGCSRDRTRRSAQHPGPPGTVGAQVPGVRGAGWGVTRRYTPPVRPADPAPIATTRTRGQRPDPGRAPAIGGPWGASRGVTPRYSRPDRPWARWWRAMERRSRADEAVR